VPLNVPLFPTQPTEMLYDLMLVALLSFLWRRQVKPAGTVFWAYVLLYSLGRGLIEFLRGDTHRGVYFGDVVSTSQMISLAGVALALVMLLRGFQQRRRTDATPS
jgi:phosphatidylglycerol:prolipoprotein diacylglycerol transferase